MIKKIIFTILALLLLTGGFFAWKIFRPAIREDSHFYIHTGDDVSTVKENLIYNEKINGGDFDLVNRLLKYKKARPGKYALKKGMNMYQLVKMLRNGEQEQVKIVIVKERTKELLAGKLGRLDLECDSLQLIQLLNNNDSLKKYDVDTNTVMAMVMPYTYSVSWNVSADKILQQFHTAYKKFWTKERKTKADSIGLTPVQVSILASIIEEETTRKTDKYNIASTYLNRLRKDMRLEADPTVKFITRNFQLGRIQGVHLKLQSPYNTYLNKGLPPGPICTPSIESIEAVLDAPKTEYIFFVASHKFDGNTIFTTNYDDHRKYVRLFHAEQKRRADSIAKLKAKK
jgi:UPF0755 protein